MMKKSTVFAALCVAALAAAGCNKAATTVDTSAKDEKLQEINVRFVDAVVIPTYNALADKCLELQEAVAAIGTSKTDASVKSACDLWKSSRQYWEWSEAFLFGAASKYKIDPHIDTWPLDRTRFQEILEDETIMGNLDFYVSNFNNGLVGFHGIEYILFRDGNERKASEITENELKYAVAVAEDLAMSACRLEAAWAGIDNVTEEKATILADAEEEPEDDFGFQMRNCGKPGSVWLSATAGTEQIIEGCKDIIDEVGTQKIGNPYTGEDTNYIESPHSWNSITDFYDNVVSIRNAYFGGLGATAPEKNSVSAYIASIDKTADEGVVSAIEACLSAINEMPRPFVKNYTDAKVGAAIEACTKLNDALEVARQALLNE